MFICDTDALVLRNCARGFAGLAGLIEGNFRPEKPGYFDLAVLAALLHDAISMKYTTPNGDYYLVVWTDAPAGSVSIEGYMIWILRRAVVVVLIRQYDRQSKSTWSSLPDSSDEWWGQNTGY